MKTLLAAPSTPYKGLAPYIDSDLDAFLFFGRERDRDVIVANLIAARLTVLYGASGVGKSSVLRAGVAYRLREVAHEGNGGPEHAVAVVDAWAGDPIDAILETVDAPREGTLARSLEAWTQQHDATLYLILDQFEEYFVYHGDDDGGPLRNELADVLTDRALRVNLLFSLREDALAQLDAFKGRIPNLFANSLRLDRLDRRAARAAIVGPVDRYNELVPADATVAIEPELVEAVLDEVTLGRVDLGTAGRGEVRTQEGGTGIEAPYLQLVMERLWEAERAESSRVLRPSTLRRLGGAVSIVRSHLERALDTLTPEQRDVAASVFNHLVTPSGTKIAHRAGDLAQYASVRESDLVPVLGTLGRERIVRAVDGAGSGAARYEIFHDVLADAVLAWRTRQQLARERHAAERRHRRLAVVAGVSLAAFALMAALAIYALSQRSDARKQARIARVHATEAYARELEARALSALDRDPQRSLELAYRAARVERGAETENVLRTALLASRLRLVLPVGGAVVSASFSPNSRWIIAGSTNGIARMFDARTGRRLRDFGHARQLSTAVPSPDGRFVLTAGSDGRARLWSARTGRLVRTLRHGPPIRAVSFDRNGSLVATAGGLLVRVWHVPSGRQVSVARSRVAVRDTALRGDGRYLVTVATDRFARLYDASTGGLVSALDQGGRVTSASFTPSGALVVTSGFNKSARTWNVATGRPLVTFDGHRGHVLAAVVDPQGKKLVTTSTDGTARVWAFGRGSLLSPLIGHKNFVTGAAFSPNGFSVVTTSKDGTARVWQPLTGVTRAVLAGHHDAVNSASFSPDGTRIVTASNDGTARVWDPQLEPPLTRLARYGSPANGMRISPDGRLFVLGTDAGARIVAASTGKTLRWLPTPTPVVSVAFSRDGNLVAAAHGRRVDVTDVQTGRRVRVLRTPAPVLGVDFGPHGLLATAGADGTARLWTDAGRLVHSFRANRHPFTSVHFDTAGGRLVTSSTDRTARIWDLRTGRGLRVLRGHTAAVASARFSPNGRFAVTASVDNDARIWNVRSGASVHLLAGHLGRVRDAEFSPDGRWIVTAGPTTAGLWDLSGHFLFFMRASFVRGHEPALTAALFEPDSRRILTAGRDGQLRAYTCDVCGRLPALVALAQRRLAAATR